MSVVVVGAINVDLVVVAPRLPGPGETVVGPQMDQFGGGKGANAAVAAARSGGEVRLIGAVGDDATGTAALDELRRDGVDVDLVARLGDVPTGVALIVVDAHGENQIAVGAGANHAVTADHVADGLRAALARGDVGAVLVSTEIPDAAVEAAVRAATGAGVRCVLNPAPVTSAVHRLIECGAVLTPNRSELRDLTGLDDPVEGARALRDRSHAPIVVTLGGEGALVLDTTGEPVHHPAHRARAVDTTGAGDTFNGVLAARLAAGLDLALAVRHAMAAAAISVESVGARGGMPTAAAIEAIVDAQTTSNQSIEGSPPL